MKSGKEQPKKKSSSKTPVPQQKTIRPATVIDRSYYPAVPLANYPFAK